MAASVDSVAEPGRVAQAVSAARTVRVEFNGALNCISPSAMASPVRPKTNPADAPARTACLSWFRRVDRMDVELRKVRRVGTSGLHRMQRVSLCYRKQTARNSPRNAQLPAEEKPREVGRICRQHSHQFAQNTDSVSRPINVAELDDCLKNQLLQMDECQFPASHAYTMVHPPKGSQQSADFTSR